MKAQLLPIIEQVAELLDAAKSSDDVTPDDVNDISQALLALANAASCYMRAKEIKAEGELAIADRFTRGAREHVQEARNRCDTETKHHFPSICERFEALRKEKGLTK